MSSISDNVVCDESNIDGDECSPYPILTEEDIKPGLEFSSREIGEKSLRAFFAKEFHPIIKVSGVGDSKNDDPKEGEEEKVKRK